jgi:TRAP-type C4-dicarboxylate transport system permease small subunit
MYAVVLILARGMARLGGGVLMGTVLLVCVSILGREANALLHEMIARDIMPGFAQAMLDMGISAVKGDIELTEAAIAFVIFAFLPICQISESHARVDILASRMSAALRKRLHLVTDFVFAVVLLLIAVQLYAGLLSKVRSGQTTFLLEFPVWWGYAASLPGATIAAFVAIMIAYWRMKEAITGQPFPAQDKGLRHE